MGDQWKSYTIHFILSFKLLFVLFHMPFFFSFFFGVGGDQKNMLVYLIDLLTQVLPAEIIKVQSNDILFKNDKLHPFDTIIFCTGFKRSTNLWLKVFDILLCVCSLFYFEILLNIIIFLIYHLLLFAR